MDMNTIREFNAEKIFYLIQSNDVDSLKKLENLVYMNHVLFYAALWNKKEICRAMLSKGADWNKAFINNMMSLDVIALKNEIDAEIVMESL